MRLFCVGCDYFLYHANGYGETGSVLIFTNTLSGRDPLERFPEIGTFEYNDIVKLETNDKKGG